MKFTPWFINGENPFRPGVYGVSRKRRDQSGNWYSHWNGKNFGPFGGTPQEALRMRRTWLSRGAGTRVLSGGSWRGLAEQPQGE